MARLPSKQGISFHLGIHYFIIQLLWLLSLTTYKLKDKGPPQKGVYWVFIISSIRFCDPTLYLLLPNSL